ncbi:MAG: glycine oxidase ThiO [Terriglobales bacterium]
MDSDVAIIGAGLIGLSLARELRRRGLRVLLFDAGPVGRQASWAGAGMLAARQTADPLLRPLAIASARLYPSWVRELERETGLSAGYRSTGTLFLASPGHPAPNPMLAGWEKLAAAQVAELEPALVCNGCQVWRIPADGSVDNRALTAALAASARTRGVDIVEQSPVAAVVPGAGGLGIEAAGQHWQAAVVVNAAGAWASQITAPVPVAVRPRKGQMLCLRGGACLRHVIEADGVYLVPRAQGRTVVGATLEDCGFAPGVDAACISGLHRRALDVVPALAPAEIEESWCGFRPCSTDERPILGPTACPGYWLAAGHFRDGILLTPITAKILASAIATGHMTRALDLAPFLPQRFV